MTSLSTASNRRVPVKNHDVKPVRSTQFCLKKKSASQVSWCKTSQEHSALSQRVNMLVKWEADIFQALHHQCLTFKVTITTAADEILTFFPSFFRENKTLHVNCQPSRRCTWKVKPYFHWIIIIIIITTIKVFEKVICYRIAQCFNA